MAGDVALYARISSFGLPVTHLLLESLADKAHDVGQLVRRAQGHLGSQGVQGPPPGKSLCET
jgi:hypothetical protein